VDAKAHGLTPEANGCRPRRGLEAGFIPKPRCAGKLVGTPIFDFIFQPQIRFSDRLKGKYFAGEAVGRVVKFPESWIYTHTKARSHEGEQENIFRQDEQDLPDFNHVHLVYPVKNNISLLPAWWLRVRNPC
jgi:hypothetical protein